MNRFPKRGEVWLIQFDPKVGSEHGETRPGVILQNDIGNEHSPATIVAALITTIRQMPIHVYLDKSDGVDRPSMILLEQIHTIDKKRLIKKLGTIRKEKFTEIFEAVLYSLGFREL
jgi:mRNA interferase MazF